MSHLRVWGAPAFQHVDKDNRNGRALHDEAILGVHVGHSPTHREGMLVCVPARGTVLSPSRDVVVHERALFTDGEPTPMPEPAEFRAEIGWERNARDPNDPHFLPPASDSDPAWGGSLPHSDEPESHPIRGQKHQLGEPHVRSRTQTRATFLQRRTFHLRREISRAEETTDLILTYTR